MTVKVIYGTVAIMKNIVVLLKMQAGCIQDLYWISFERSNTVP